MSATGVQTFDRTIQKTNEWLNDIMHELGTYNREEAYAALHATLHALRDRLTIDEGAQLAAQLPMLVRGIYYEGWDPSGKPTKERHKAAFLAHVEAMYGKRCNVDAERAARAVFAVLAKRVSSGEIQDVLGILPHELRELWPASVGV